MADARLFAVMVSLAAATFAPDAQAVEGSAGLELQGGAFGLFNLDFRFTKAAPTLAFAPSIELRVHSFVALGAETMFVWARPEPAPNPRFSMSPQARVRLMFPVHPRINVDVVLAAGVAIWPRNAEDTTLSPAVADTRVGWSGRAGLGMSFVFTERWSLHFDLGYFVASTSGNGVWLTHDTGLLTVGPRVHF